MPNLFIAESGRTLPHVIVVMGITNAAYRCQTACHANWKLVVEPNAPPKVPQSEVNCQASNRLNLSFNSRAKGLTLYAVLTFFCRDAKGHWWLTVDLLSCWGWLPDWNKGPSNFCKCWASTYEWVLSLDGLLQNELFVLNKSLYFSNSMILIMLYRSEGTNICRSNPLDNKSQHLHFNVSK